MIDGTFYKHIRKIIDSAHRRKDPIMPGSDVHFCPGGEIHIESEFCDCIPEIMFYKNHKIINHRLYSYIKAGVYDL